MKVTEFSTEILAKSLSLRLNRHAAIASNIANADTPGYRPRQVAFEDALQKAQSTESRKQLNQVIAKTELVDDGVPRLDGNSVSLDRQMANLSENTMLYNVTAEMLGRKLRMIKSVIA